MALAATPVQVTGTVLTTRRVDAYHALTVVAPGIAERFRPGHFVSVAVGGAHTSMVTRRAFFIHDVKPEYGGTVELVFTIGGPGTTWLAGRRARDTLDLVGPLGRPFPLPRDPVTAVAVEFDIPVQVAVQESMACGIGVCMTCVVPVAGADGVTRMVRACVEGPVFRGEQVRFEDVGTIPFDALGAPGGGARHVS